MPKYKTKFNAKMKADFPFLKADCNNQSIAICTVCKSSFSVGNTGAYAIKQHINSATHKKTSQAPNDNKNIKNFFPSLSANDKDLAYVFL